MDENKTAQPPLEWDENLNALKVTLVPANAAPGDTYWRLIRASYDACARIGGQLSHWRQL